MIELIEIEAAADSIMVSASIDIIKVTRKKAKWLQKKQSCN